MKQLWLRIVQLGGALVLSVIVCQKFKYWRFGLGCQDGEVVGDGQELPANR